MLKQLWLRILLAIFIWAILIGVAYLLGLL